MPSETGLVADPDTATRPQTVELSLERGTATPGVLASVGSRNLVFDVTGGSPGIFAFGEGSDLLDVSGLGSGKGRDTTFASPPSRSPRRPFSCSRGSRDGRRHRPPEGLSSGP